MKTNNRTKRLQKYTFRYQLVVKRLNYVLNFEGVNRLAEEGQRYIKDHGQKICMNGLWLHRATTNEVYWQFFSLIACTTINILHG